MQNYKKTPIKLQYIKHTFVLIAIQSVLEQRHCYLKGMFKKSSQNDLAKSSPASRSFASISLHSLAQALYI